MRFAWRKHVTGELELARAEREESEKRLAHAEEHVIVPLRELRAANHVSEIIEALIQRRARQQQGGRR